MSTPSSCLVLRLAGPLQSWGGASRLNRRATNRQPTKGAIIGLLAAAQGRRRADPIEDLVHLRLGVRTDRPGELLRDFHTISDAQGLALRSSTVDGKGRQKRTSPPKYTHVTERYYLQDAVFVAAIDGDLELLLGLRDALRHPAFPLALGRRSCVPTIPVLLDAPASGDECCSPLWPGDPLTVLSCVPWQAARIGADERSESRSSTALLPVMLDDRDGPDLEIDVPRTFDPKRRSFTTRPVRHDWVRVSTGIIGGDDDPGPHDPFALLGW